MPVSTYSPYPRFGRRYSLRIEGELFDAADFNYSRSIYNPSNLNADARKVAAHVARVLDVEVIVVKHLKDEDRDEGYYRAGGYA